MQIIINLSIYSSKFYPSVVLRDFEFTFHQEVEDIVKLATIVEGNPKAPFSIATTPMCRGGRYSLMLRFHSYCKLL